jgi:hypothetical protein
MFITELFLLEMSSDVIEPTPAGYASEEDDQSILKLSDMRKTRLTLGQLNKLRMMNDIRKVEHEQKLKTVSSQYKPAAQEGGMGM